MFEHISQYIPENNEFIFLTLAGVALFVLVVGSLWLGKGKYRYGRREGLLTPAEVKFFKVLEGTVDDRYRIYCKVRIADVLKVMNAGSSRKQRFAALASISQKHFDFVVVDRHSFKFVCAVELDDSSHNTKKGKKRDLVVNRACKSAGFPLVRVVAKRHYYRAAIENEIASALRA